MAQRKSVVDFEIKGANGLNTIKQLEDRVRTLRKEWRNAADEATRALKLEELKTAGTELSRHTSMVKAKTAEMATAWADFKKNFLSVATGVMGGNLMTVAAQFLIGVVPGMISKAGKLSDSLADVRKTTGMTRAEVEALNRDLKNMDTRTSREELRKLASEAGKLGKESTEDVLAFVNAADKITVALGEDLGADAVTKIGKITQTFDLEKLYGTEQAMLKVGSAVNSIGQASTANEKNIVEFTYRTQGLASAAGIAVGDILGYAATLDMAGQSMEVGATVTNKLFVALGTDVPKFAKLAKMGVQDFAKLLQTDANEALIRVLENVKGNNAGLLGMAEILKKLGSEGQESTNVVSALANNTETLRQQQALGNTEFEKGTSILNEFNIKNNSTAGILEKISHWWDKITDVNSGGWIDWMITKFGKLVGVVNELDLSIQGTAEDINELDRKNKELAETEKKLIPLINRYDELKKKTKLNNTEQTELKTVVQGIASVMPSAVTELDKYGNALSINTTKAREFIKIQKDYLKVENASKIDATQKELDMLQRSLATANKRRLETEKTVLTDNRLGTVQTSKKTTADYQKENEFIAKLNRDIEMKSNYLKKLNGDFMDATGTSATTPTVTPPVVLGEGNLGKGAGKTTERVDKEIEEQKRLKDELRKIRNKMEVEQLDGKEKELKEVKIHYTELRLRAKNNAENIVEIDALEKAERESIEAKYEAKLNESLAKVYEDKRREGMNAAEREIATTMDKYEKLIELAGDNEAKIKEITALEAAEIDAIRKKYAKSGTDVIEQSLIELERLRNDAGFALDTQVMSGAIDPQAANMKKLEIEQEYLASSYLMYALYGQERLDLAEQFMANEQELDFKRAEFSKRIDEEIKQSTFALNDAKRQAYMSGLGALRGFFKQSSGIYKALFLAEKAIAIADVIIKGIRERAAIRAYAATLGPAGIGLGIVQSNISRINTFSAVAGIAAQAFQEIAMKEAGGYTDVNTMYGSPKGFVNAPTLFNLGRRSFIAGEAGREFVISNDALRNPVVADFTRMLDVMQKTGDYSQLSASSGGDNEQVSGQILALRGDIKQMNALLARTANRPMVFEYKKFEDYEDFIFEIRSSVSA